MGASPSAVQAHDDLCLLDSTRVAALVSPIVSERKVARTLLPRALRGGETVICDKGYVGCDFALRVGELGARIDRPPGYPDRFV